MAVRGAGGSGGAQGRKAPGPAHKRRERALGYKAARRPRFYRATLGAGGWGGRRVRSNLSAFGALLCVTGGRGRGYTGDQNRAWEGRMKIQIRVESHAGYRADEYPLRFVLRERPFEVLEVEDRWYSPGQPISGCAPTTATSISFVTRSPWTYGRWTRSGPRANTRLQRSRWT